MGPNTLECVLLVIGFLVTLECGVHLDSQYIPSGCLWLSLCRCPISPERQIPCTSHQWRGGRHFIYSRSCVQPPTGRGALFISLCRPVFSLQCGSDCGCVWMFVSRAAAVLPPLASPAGMRSTLSLIYLFDEK